MVTADEAVGTAGSGTRICPWMYPERSAKAMNNTPLYFMSYLFKFKYQRSAGRDADLFFEREGLS
jgi:hypothetical protein